MGIAIYTYFVMLMQTSTVNTVSACFQIADEAINVLPDQVINPRSACAVWVTVVVPCVCVCVLSNQPPHTLESQKRGTNGFIAIREPFKIVII